jgi:hypothetical protein
MGIETFPVRNLKIDPRDQSWVAGLVLQRRSHWPTELRLVFVEKRIYL